MAWTDTFLAKRRSDWISKIGKAQYYADGTWRDGKITLKEVQGTTCVIRFTLTDEEAITITQFRLLDTGGEVAFTESSASSLKSSNSAIFIKVKMLNQQISTEF